MNPKILAALVAAGLSAAGAAAAADAPKGDKPKMETAATPATTAKAGASAMPGIEASGPRLRMAKHAGRNPGRDRDLRACLDRPSDKEVIACTEGK